MSDDDRSVGLGRKRPGEHLDLALRLAARELEDLAVLGLAEVRSDDADGRKVERAVAEVLGNHLEAPEGAGKSAIRRLEGLVK